MKLLKLAYEFKFASPESKSLEMSPQILFYSDLSFSCYWEKKCSCWHYPYFSNLLSQNKRNDKRFNNRGYWLFFLMGIFLQHLWLIPNIFKWQDCKIFTKLIPSKTPSRSSHQRCSVKNDVLKNLRNFTDLMACNFIQKRLQHRCFPVKFCKF